MTAFILYHFLPSLIDQKMMPMSGLNPYVATIFLRLTSTASNLIVTKRKNHPVRWLFRWISQSGNSTEPIGNLLIGSEVTKTVR